MDYEKLIEQLHNFEACAYGYHINGKVLVVDCSDFEQVMVDAAEEISKIPTLQAENEKLRAELKSKVDLVFQQAKELDRRHLLLQEQEAELEQVKRELSAYKELGPVDRLRELKQADDEGRCVVLKCKPNATVWFIKSAFSTAHFPIEGNHVSIKGVACDGDIYCSAITAYNKISRSFYMSDIGKTVFLTREEAEAALRRKQEKEEAEHETS